MWDKVYAGVNPMQVQTEEGPLLDVMSFRMVAEIDGRVFVATHVITQQHLNEFPIQYGFILDEMVEFIEEQAKKPRGSNPWGPPV